MITSRPKFRNQMRQQRGFSLIEVLISAVLLTVGLTFLAGVFGLALAATETAKEAMTSKQLANQAIESVLAARSSSKYPFSRIDNSANGGIFQDGPQPINLPDAEGLVGVSSTTPATFSEPGPDGVFGTSDDRTISLANYTREIKFSPLTASDGTVLATLRRVTITVTYRPPQGPFPRTYVLTSYVSQYH